jgi:phenylacetate-CoA ligase
MSAYGALYRGLLMPAWENSVRRRPTLRYLRELEETQWSTPATLQSLQSARLQRLLAHACEHVPYYANLFDEIGVRPRDIRSPADLCRLPLLTREAARLAGDRRRSTAPPFPTIQKRTGGSTGEPLTFGYEVDSECWRQAIRLRAYAWAGSRPGERTLHFWGRHAAQSQGLRSLKVAIDRGLRREHFVDCGVRSDDVLRSVVRWIARQRPAAIVSYCHAAVDLARFITTHEMRSWGSIPVVCCAEELLASDREILVAAFGPAVFETYGCREFMLIASECEAHEGLHLSAENLIVEILVRQGHETRAALPGETGEVVVTDLHNLGMPFIRYATSDLAVAGSDAPCSCGRAAPRIEAVRGRVTETLRHVDGSRVEGMLFSILFTQLADAVRQFQVVQSTDRSITLTVVPDRTFTEGERETIRARCRQYLGDVAVRIEEVQGIPDRANGKRQLVRVES